MGNIFFSEAFDDVFSTGEPSNGFKNPNSGNEVTYPMTRRPAAPNPQPPRSPVVVIDGDQYDVTGDVVVKKYGTRTFSIWLQQKLLAVTVYKKGAFAIKGVVETLQRENTNLKNQLAECSRQNRVA